MTNAADTSDSPFQLLRDAQYTLQPVLYRPQTFKDDFETAVRSVSTKVIQACDIDQDAALASILINNPYSYSTYHSVNAAVLAALFAKHEESSEQEIEAVVSAALTMNLAIAELQDSVFKSGEKLNLLQQSSFESHARLTHKTLTEKKIKNREWLNAVMQHHERPDGTGFLHMRGDAITKLARILAAADRYCVQAIAQCQEREIKSSDLLRRTVRNDNDIAEVVENYGAVLGDYVPGSFVQLANNEIAVVVRRGENPAKPIVSSLGKPGQLSLTQAQERQSSEDQFAVTKQLPLKMSFNKAKLVSLWGYAELQDPASAAEMSAAQ